MPTKTCKRISNQRAHLFPQSETELFPVEICRHMASVLDISDPGEIARLHGILNDPGSFAYLATYLKKAGVPNCSQRASLKNLSKLLEKTIKAIDEPDWQIERVRRGRLCQGKTGIHSCGSAARFTGRRLVSLRGEQTAVKSGHGGAARAYWALSAAGGGFCEIILIERSARFWPVDHPLGSLAVDGPKARFASDPGKRFSALGSASERLWLGRNARARVGRPPPDPPISVASCVL
jgi:hypothetical protein